MADPLDRSAETGEALERLAEAMASELAQGRTLDLGALAGQYGVTPEEARKVKEVVDAFALALGEDPLPPTAGSLPLPSLPPDYDLLDEIGRGGMGVVYRVRQRSLGRTVALKVLRPGELFFGDAIRRFQKEAQSLARLRHRHIVSIHEVGESAGQVYYTMDLIEGTSLSELIRQKQVTPTRAVKILRQVSSAIAYAHSQGIIHRDLKPANILVDPAGDAYVVDFGLARDAAVKGDLTTAGHLLGTPAYMSPEQARGEAPAIGEATDVYSLGAVLYECLTGRPPFRAASLADLIHAVINDDPPPPRKIAPKTPRDLEIVCLKALSKEPDRRFPTVRAFLEDLERFEEGRPIRARKPSFYYRASRFAARQASPLAAASITGALLLFLILAFIIPKIGKTPETLLGTAEELQAAGQHSGAVVLLERALKEKPSAATEEKVRSALLHSRLAIVRELEKQGRWADAEALCLKMKHAFRRESEPEVLWELSRCLAKRGEREEAETLLDDLEETLEDRQQHENMKLAEWPESSPSVGLPLLDRAAPALLDPSDPGHDGAGVFFLRKFGKWPHHSSAADRWFASQGDRAVDLAIAIIPFLSRDYLGTDGIDFYDRVMSIPGSRLERQLILLARNPEKPILSRRFAADLLSHRLDLPTWFGGWRKESHGGDDPVPIDQAAHLASELLELPAVTAYRRRVEAAMAALDGPFHGDFDSGWLSAWLTDHTGVKPRGKTAVSRSFEWRTWWKDHGTGNPEEWLRAALGIGQPLPLPALLERYLPCQELDERILLHQLLVLSLPPGTPIPLRRSGWGRGEPPGRAMAWYRAVSGSHPAAPYLLRIAHFSFRNASPDPLLLWQETRPIRIGDDLQSARHVENVLFPTEVVRLLVPGLQYEDEIPMRAKETHQVYAELKWQQDGLLLHLGQHEGPQGIVVFENDLYPSGRAPWPYHETPVTLAVAFPPGSDSKEWTLAEWKRKVTGDLEFLLEGIKSDQGNPSTPFYLKYQQSLRLYPEFTAHLPFPEAKETLAHLDQATRAHPRMGGKDFSESHAWLPARLLAGDPAPLLEPTFASDLKTSLREKTQRTPYACRLYQSTQDPRILEVALGLLSEREIPAEILLAFLPKMKRGLLPAPAWLLEQAEKADRSEQEKKRNPRLRCLLIGGAGGFAALLVLGWTLWPGRPFYLRLRGAALLVLVGLGFVAGVSEVDGRDLLPDSVGYALSALGAGLLARSSRRRLSYLPAAAFLLGGILDLVAGAVSHDRFFFRLHSTTFAAAGICSLPILIRALDRVSPAVGKLPRRGVLVATFPFGVLAIAAAQVGMRVQALAEVVNSLWSAFPFLPELLLGVIFVAWVSLFSAAGSLSRRIGARTAPPSAPAPVVPA